MSYEPVFKANVKRPVAVIASAALIGLGALAGLGSAYVVYNASEAYQNRTINRSLTLSEDSVGLNSHVTFNVHGKFNRSTEKLESLEVIANIPNPNYSGAPCSYVLNFESKDEIRKEVVDSLKVGDEMLSDNKKLSLIKELRTVPRSNYYNDLF